MPDASIVQLADEVVEVLNAASLSLPFAAERSYVPIHVLDEMDVADDPLVTVVPARQSITPLDRGRDDVGPSIDVGVFRKVATADPADVDPLMALAEEVADLFRGATLAFGPYGEHSAAVQSVEIDPIFDPAQLDERRVFASVVRLTFRHVRARS